MQDGMGTLRKVAGKFLIVGLALMEVLAMAGCSGGSSSTSGNQTATPAFSPGGGSYHASQPVTISDATQGAVLYCTTDGTTPTTSSPQCSQPTTVFQSEFLQAIAVAPNLSPSAVASAGYTIGLPAAATPTFSPGGGTYTSAQTVTIGDTTTGATIYYTTDGTVPAAPTSTSTSKLYTGPVTVSVSEPLSAIAIASGYVDSEVASTKYTISQPIAAPTFSVPTGTYTSAQTVTISDTAAGAAIYYTLDGSAPTAKSTPYTGKITVSKTEVVSAVAILAGNSSAVSTAAYAIVQSIPAPTFNPASGATITAGQTVTITDGDTNASIYYTTNGTTPTANSTPYTAPFALSNAGTATIEAIAIDAGNNSSVATATYTVGAAAPSAPSFNPASGATVSVGQTVTITDGDTNASIYYTLDGSVPTANSTAYTAPVALTTAGTATLEAIAIDAGKSSSAATATYTVTTNGLPLAGVVSSGAKFINGAKVQLYAAGQLGYGSAGTAVGTAVTTDSSGAFTLNYNCPAAPGDQMYVVATGGDSGSGANSGIALLAALGTCSSLPSSVTVNEVTTIASAYALSAFATIDTANGGIDIGAPGTVTTTATTCNAANNWASSGPNTCNYTGLVNAFNAVNNLVNVSTGQALTHTPAYPTDLAGDSNIVNNSQVPTTRINALADMLASCVESSGSGCSSGGGLFTAASTTGSTPITPTDTLQAALNIAQNPGNNVADLLKLVSTTPPYSITSTDTGTLVLSGSGAPVDLTLALTFTGAGLGIYPATTTLSDGNQGIVNTSLGIDAAGNIWVGAFLTGNPYFGQLNGEMVAEFNALGAHVTQPTTLSPGATPQPAYGGFNPQPTLTPANSGITMLTIDQTGNIWTNNGGSGGSSLDQYLLEISSSLSLLNTERQSQSGAPTSVTLDSSGNVWYTSSLPNVVELPSTGTTGVTGPNLGNTISGLALAYLAFDSNGGLWVSGSNASGTDVYQINTSDGSILYDAFPSSSTGLPTTLAADGAGNIYACDPTGLNLDVFNGGVLINSHSITTQRACGSQLVLDGQGHLFAVLDNGSGFPIRNQYLGIDEYTIGGTPALPAITLISPALTGYTGSSSAEAPTLNPDTTNYTQAPPGTGAAIDRSGNLWVLNVDTDGTNFSVPGAPTVQPGNVLVEYIGIGAPVITPASTGLATFMLGSRP
ncbi:S-layer family protein [Granulicella sp. S156]|uniref:beta strand repeat-containing protein n=1 Tax=Granulicella sp. S156 TaxID=1747224 RepID=UPI00131C66C3|nr:chitobiase/beta-hexosaminidase C-terminal domain-containing protein [Granulicella sp. S156]